jgi:hypothetical protein
MNQEPTTQSEPIDPDLIVIHWPTQQVYPFEVE